jgi:hypothetical protein
VGEFLTQVYRFFVMILSKVQAVVKDISNKMICGRVVSKRREILFVLMHACISLRSQGPVSVGGGRL